MSHNFIIFSYSTVNNTDEEHRMPWEEVKDAIKRKVIDEHNKVHTYNYTYQKCSLLFDLESGPFGLLKDIHI